MFPWLIPIAFLLVLFLVFLRRIRKDRLMRSLARNLYKEIVSHRLGPHRRLVVGDLAWTRAEPLLFTLDPLVHREVTVYYHLAGETKRVLEEQVPLRLASAPGQVVRYMQSRQSVLRHLGALRGVEVRAKERLGRPSNPPHGDKHDRKVSVGRSDLRLPDRRRHR